MPPKKGQKAPPKTEVAKKQKQNIWAEEQEQVSQSSAQVQKNIKAADKPRQDAAAAKKSKKEAEEQRQRELNELFAEAIKQPKVPVGVDPKSIVCEYYRHGRCTKGFKCKFSHDLNVERKGGKIDIYTERRDGENEDGMDDWDQDKLEDVVKQKHGTEKPNRTSIVCKYFLDAVEKKMYGWFWQCPNGKECQYRHALPPGYVLKSQMKELLEEEAANKKSIEDVIEEERSKVDAKTPITQAVFEQWRHKKREERVKAAEDAEADRKRKGLMTGREIFAQEGFVLDDDMGATDDFTRDNDEEEEFMRARRKADEENARRRMEEGHPPESSAGSSSAPDGAASSNAAANGIAGSSEVAPESGLKLSKEEEALFDDDDLEDEELDELEAKLGSTRVG